MSIPLHLITGFLGSGKTSFLKHFLDQHSGRGKLAIIQNEFSPVNIDGRELLQGKDYQILEINNGSAFCVCLLGSFIKSVEKFIDDIKPDMLIMEASGLSDPTAVGQMFQSKELKGKVYLSHIWCLVDVLNYNRFPSFKVRLERQIRSADTVILNKTDLAREELGDVTNFVNTINPFAQVVSGTYGKVDLSPMRKAFNVFPVGKDGSLQRPDIESVVIRSSHEISRSSLQSFLRRIKTRSIRCKGVVKLRGEVSIWVQGVFDDFSFQEVSTINDVGELVLIGSFGKDENLQVIYEEYCRNEN